MPGAYFYDGQVVDLVARLKPSARGELEITDLNKISMEKGKLRVVRLGRGIAWLDAGMHESLLQAAKFVKPVEERQGLMISCPEEIAYRTGYNSADELRIQGEAMSSNSYGDYLLRLLNDKTF